MVVKLDAKDLKSLVESVVKAEKKPAKKLTVEGLRKIIREEAEKMMEGIGGESGYEVKVTKCSMAYRNGDEVRAEGMIDGVPWTLSSVIEGGEVDSDVAEIMLGREPLDYEDWTPAQRAHFEGHSESVWMDIVDAVQGFLEHEIEAAKIEDRLEAERDAAEGEEAMRGLDREYRRMAMPSRR